MPDLDRLPPDQRAVLSLVLERGRSYREVAQLLGIPEGTVRERAHAALDALGDPGWIDLSPHAGGGEGQAASRAGSAGEAPGDRGAPGERTTGSGAADRLRRAPQGSRRAGAVLLTAIAIVAVVVVVLVAGGGKGSGKATTGTNTGTSTTKPTLDNTIHLTAAEPGSKASGEAVVLSEGSRRAFYVAAENLPPSSGFFYAVWLYNSSDEAAALGRAPTVGTNGHMEGGGPLPSDADSFHRIVITRETSDHPGKPGPIVLSGAFALH